VWRVQHPTADVAGDGGLWEAIPSAQASLAWRPGGQQQCPLPWPRQTSPVSQCQTPPSAKAMLASARRSKTTCSSRRGRRRIGIGFPLKIMIPDPRSSVTKSTPRISRKTSALQCGLSPPRRERSKRCSSRPTGRRSRPPWTGRVVRSRQPASTWAGASTRWRCQGKLRRRRQEEQTEAAGAVRKNVQGLLGGAGRLGCDFSPGRATLLVTEEAKSDAPWEPGRTRPAYPWTGALADCATAALHRIRPHPFPRERDRKPLRHRAVRIPSWF